MARKPVVIDFHAHFMTEEVFAATYSASVIGRLRQSGRPAVIRPFPEALVRKMTDLDLRLDDMDAMGVDIQVISPNILHQCTYSLDPRRGAAAGAHQQRPRGRDRGEKARPADRARLSAAAGRRQRGRRRWNGRCATSASRASSSASRVNDAELGDVRLRPFWRARKRSACRSSSIRPAMPTRVCAPQHADLARPAAGGGLRADLARLRRRDGRIPAPQDRLRAWRRLHSLLRRPLRLDVPPRLHQADEGRLQRAI